MALQCETNRRFIASFSFNALHFCRHLALYINKYMSPQRDVKKFFLYSPKTAETICVWALCDFVVLRCSDTFHKVTQCLPKCRALNVTKPETFVRQLCAHYSLIFSQLLNPLKVGFTQPTHLSVQVQRCYASAVLYEPIGIRRASDKHPLSLFNFLLNQKGLYYWKLALLKKVFLFFPY